MLGEKIGHASGPTELKVLPAKNACEFCDYDLLCRVEKSPNH